MIWRIEQIQLSKADNPNKLSLYSFILNVIVALVGLVPQLHFSLDSAALYLRAAAVILKTASCSKSAANSQKSQRLYLQFKIHSGVHIKM